MISGGRRYSSDLPQGGLEIPCVLIFKTTKVKECTKTQGILDNARFKVHSVSQEQDNDGPLDAYEDSTINPVVNGKLALVDSCSLESSTQAELTTQDVQDIIGLVMQKLTMLKRFKGSVSKVE